MTITPFLFEAFLKCPTKCWLRTRNEIPSGNTYAEWTQSQNESYRAAQTERLLGETPAEESVRSPAPEKLKTSKWRLAVDVVAQVSSASAPGGTSSASPTRPANPWPRVTQPSEVLTMECSLHALERVPAEGRGKAAQFIPIRFVFFNKLTQDDKLLLAFDAFVLAQALGRDITIGKIIHGDRSLLPEAGGCARQSAADSDRTANDQDARPKTAALSRAQPRVTKVKTAALAGEVRKRLEKLAALLTNPTPPDLVVNRHCAECEFQARCRKIAIEKDDLSLLAGMSAKERQKLRSKGIFTVTQLSYTFLPRRRPKRLRDKREKYHHSLKALAIREKKIHIVGSPELKIEGTPIYLDVEGLPDRDFYYLIGMRIGHGDSAVQHSLWADTVADEGKIWREFLAILETVEKPVLIHYGSYETEFLEVMRERYGEFASQCSVEFAGQSAVNVLAAFLGQVYFPTHSNGLKDVATWLGFSWGGISILGVDSMACRCKWEQTKNQSLKTNLIAYNAADCSALCLVLQTLLQLKSHETWTGAAGDRSGNAVSVESLRGRERKVGTFVSPFADFEKINLAAWWDYQRDRVYVRSRNRRPICRPRDPQRSRDWKTYVKVNKLVLCPEVTSCPACGGVCSARTRCTRILYDLLFGRSSVKRWVVKYRFRHSWCPSCQKAFGEPKEFWPRSHFGRSLIAYVLYQTIDLCVPLLTVQKNIARFFGLAVPFDNLIFAKKTAARLYKGTYETILRRILTGGLLHVDETQVSIRGKTGYVWIFTNLHEVAFWYAESREGGFLQEMLKDFKGVLVSDFFSAYDSVNCQQQKCLIHLMRDLNDDVLKHPYDEELKVIVRDFASLLKPIVETIDRRGLKRRFLRKHVVEVKCFYRKLSQHACRSEQATKCKQRFEKNRDRLFTFLNHDDVPWNNNNAEHAIRAFARLRDIVRGSFTASSAQNYLVLLSVCQTCKYMGVDFLDFLRSGEKDIHAFAESRRGRRRRPPTPEPQASPGDSPAEP